MGGQTGCKLTSRPENASPQQICSPTTAAAKSTQTEAFHSFETSGNLIDHTGKEPKRLGKDPAAASNDQVGVWQSLGKKRLNNTEGKSLCKRRRRSIPDSQLSEQNLKKLERDLEKLKKVTPNEMDPSVTIPDRLRKRAPSRQSSFSDLNQETASVYSQKSSVSNSYYRYHVLHQARMYVRPELPPANIQAQMDFIFERKISEKREREISGIAKKISQSFVNNLRGAHREDDLVELIYEALRMIQEDETFDFPRKAGIVHCLIPIYMSLHANYNLDWNPSLKPEIQQNFWKWVALGRPNNEADDVVDRPSKRQQGERPFTSPNTSQSTMPPPTILSQSKQDAVKTPRPDFTIGFRDSTISNALTERGLSEFKADDFLNWLQLEQKLCSDPTQNFLNVRFPILVIEGKAYATGKTAFEAQNQAVVSGSCMINLQQQLTELFESVFPNLKGEKIPLAFSICTEGPQIEFWVHYTLLKENVRSHHMNIFRTCYGSLQGGLKDFLMDVDRLMRWAEDEFLKEVVDQLCKLAEHVEREA